MPKTLIADYRVFLRELFRDFQSTGAIAPSSPWLAAALTRYLTDSGQPKRVLEVGPGTGAVTTKIVAALGPLDQLDLVELNPRFVAILRQRFEADVRYQRVAAQARVIHQPVQDLPREDGYDLIISGLPLNNFPAALLDEVLESLSGLLNPGGTLSFFQYVAVRPARAIVSGRVERLRLREVGAALGKVLDRHEFRRDLIWPNLPPAWVHHLRFDA